MLKNSLRCFLICSVVAILIMVPDIILNKGMFIYAGDYYSQQIPFNFHAVGYISSGKIGWDWNTELGTDFIGSYSFYLLGSPFFWILSFFSKNIVIYLIPVMIALKTGVAGLTSFIYIKRYVKNETCCFLGAFMYAFSGFQMFNIIYNHFHDVTALFPLLLLSFDMLVTENKRGFFALVTALMAFTNYFFFAGEVVFIIIYYIIRCSTKSFSFSVKNFLVICLESAAGVMMSAVLLLPSFFTVFSGSRVSEVLFGTNLISYSDNTIVPKILQSLFIIPDLPSRAQLFKSDFNPNNWASISLYIPVFASVGVVTFIKNNKKSFITRLLCICLVFACIPVLNSFFYLFNATYYARWFFMPVLFMCIATTKCLEEKYDLILGMKFQVVGLVILSVIGIMPNKVNNDTSSSDYLSSGSNSGTVKWFGMSEIPVVFWQSIAFGVIFLLIIYVYNAKKDSDEKMLKMLPVLVVVFSLVNGYQYLHYTKGNIEIQNAYEILSDDSPCPDDEEFYRINILGTGKQNLNMIWDKSTVGQFHSIVPGSTETLYSKLAGKQRRMESEYTEKDFPVYGLLSVKYIFNESTGDDLNVQVDPVDIPGFELYDKKGYFYVYKNQHYVPVGFMYDKYITESDLSKYIDSLELDVEQKQQYLQLAMMRVMVLDEDDVLKYSGVIEKANETDFENLTEDTYFSDCDKKAENTCYEFTYDHKGFSAKYNSDRKGLILFSVPSAKGWSAKVNGENTSIITAQYGLSAVEVSIGENTIEFSYETPGLKAGFYLSIAGVSLFVLYLIIYSIVKKGRQSGKN